MHFIMLFLLSSFFITQSFCGEKVNYSIDNKIYEGYLILNKPSAPLVFMVHDWDGITNYETKRAQMLADLGYSVFIVDLFGAGVRPQKIEDKKKITDALYKDRMRMRKLLNGAIEIAKAKGANIESAFAVGYCFGGASVLEWARSGAKFKGFISFHGGLQTPEGQDYSQVKAKLLVLHGTADAAVSMSDFAQLAQTLEQQKISHEMITYSGAPHAFTVWDSPAYREDADKKSWQRFISFLKELK